MITQIHVIRIGIAIMGQRVIMKGTVISITVSEYETEKREDPVYREEIM